MSRGAFRGQFCPYKNGRSGVIYHHIAVQHHSGPHHDIGTESAKGSYTLSPRCPGLFFMTALATCERQSNVKVSEASLICPR